ncbi:ferric-chelate reductase 1-like [Triplophysa dalaica]|uniref:ferric-chelate reductase 1-like n=1 Tax=Triplophysa dalaica TaxID=1582913 RepID=UPI0024DF49ED|nr:ferric-chelate reductase 1-like [Triplophysa dalaica]
MDSRLVCLVVFVISSAVPYTKANGIITPLNYNFTHSDCGTTKLCVEKPNACNPSGTSECFFASTRINITDKSLAIELSGSSIGYIALAAGLSSNLSKGDNAIFVCGNNSGTFFFETGGFQNKIVTVIPFNASNIQYRLKQPSVIQCAFTIPINLSNNNINILGINFNKTKIPVFLEVYKGSYNGGVFGEPMTAFGSSVSVDLADVKSSGATNSISTTTALGLLAAVALRFL